MIQELSARHSHNVFSANVSKLRTVIIACIQVIFSEYQVSDRKKIAELA